MSSKHFTGFIQVERLKYEGKLLEKYNRTFSFDMINIIGKLGVILSVCLRRAVQMKIPRYYCKTIIVEEDSTTIREEILDNIRKIHFDKKIMSKLDLNLYELTLDVENKTEQKIIPITADNFVLRNIEQKTENKSIMTKDILLYNEDLLFYLLRGKKFKCKCKLGYSSKKETTATNQGGILSPSYYEDSNGNIDSIHFHHCENDTSMSNKEFISMGFNIIQNDIFNIKEILQKNDTSKFNIKLLTVPIFNIVVSDIDSSYSLLISKWISHHDSLAICSTNNKTICYGLCKYKNKLSNNKNILDSKTEMDEKEYNKIKKETMKTFIEHVSRLHKYILLLEADWKKVKLQKTIPIYPEYSNMYNLSRKEHRLKEQKQEKKTTIFS